MSSSVTTKALQRGCVVLSHTPGFFSTAVSLHCPVTGAGLVCRALAIAESSVLSEQEGPTLCKPLGSSIVFTSSSAISNAFNPLNFLSQNSCLGWSTPLCKSVFTLLLGWFVTLVTGCLKMDAVCRTGSVVFKSGFALI